MEITDITAQVRPSILRLARTTHRRWWGAMLLRRLGMRLATQHGNIGARDIARALERDLWCECILTATAL